MKNDREATCTRIHRFLAHAFILLWVATPIGLVLALSLLIPVFVPRYLVAGTVPGKIGTFATAEHQ